MIIDICERYKNIIVVATVSFTLALVFALFMVLYYGINMIVSLIVIVVLLNVVHGARNIFSSITAFKMRKQINSGAFCALTNSAASLGAGIAPTIIGAIIDSVGWQMSYLTIFAVDGVIVAILVVLSLIVNANLKKQKPLVK